MRAPPPLRPVHVLSVLAVLAGVGPGMPAGASFGALSHPPVPAPMTDPGTRSALAWEQVLFLPDPGARVVAVAIRFPAGSASDPVGAEGRAFLFARVLEATANQQLAALQARVQVEVAPLEFMVTVLAPPSGWSRAVQEVVTLLHTATPSAALLESARTNLLQILRFEEGSPGRAFERERAFLLLGTTHPAARPVPGTAGTLPGLGVEDLVAFRSEHLRDATGTIVVTGPIVEADVRSAFGTAITLPAPGRRSETPPRPLPTETPAPPPAAAADTWATAEPGSLPAAPLLRGPSQSPALRIPPPGSSPRAWESGDRAVLDRQVTATWMAMAFPFPEGSPPLLLDFLAHLVMENLNRTPPDPGLYEAWATVEQVRGAPVIVISASVDPFRSSEWESRLSGAFEVLGDSPPVGAFFELTRRRFRSRLIMEMAAPENVVVWTARRAELGWDRIEDPEHEIWRLTPESVADAARGAGPIRALLYGPQGLGSGD